MELKELGKLVKQARERKKLLQSELAEKIGVDQSHISRLEQGKKGLAFENWLALATVLDLPQNLNRVETINADYEKPSQSPRQRILSNYESPKGLHDLAADNGMVEAMKITDEEFNRLALISLPDTVTKEGYLQILISIRAAIGAK